MNQWQETWYRELDDEQNRYLMISGEATVGQALAMLKDDKINGRLWWLLIVPEADGWRICRFQNIVPQNGTDVTLETPLAELNTLKPAAVDDLNRIGVGAARARAVNAPGQALVIIENDEMVGVVSAGDRRSAEIAAASNLLALPGKYADLSKFSNLLIKKHQSHQPQKRSEKNDVIKTN